MSNVVIRNSDLKALTTQLDFILLDGSGSMISKWWPMLSCIDQYIAGLKTNNIDSHILMHVFDSNALDLEARNTHISDWQPFNVQGIEPPGGSTPLYDAIVIMGRTIRDLNPAKGCAITIVTDGEEAGSQFASLDQAKAVLDWLRAQGYSVTFIGCDFNNARQARALGANETNAIGVQKHLLSDAGSTLAKKRAHHARTGEQVNFTKDEQQQFGGYLTSK